jgi:hypothetical protein
MTVLVPQTRVASEPTRRLSFIPSRNAYMFGGCTEVRVSIGSQLFVMVGSVQFCVNAKLGVHQVLSFKQIIGAEAPKVQWATFCLGSPLCGRHYWLQHIQV